MASPRQRLETVRARPYNVSGDTGRQVAQPSMPAPHTPNLPERPQAGLRSIRNRLWVHNLDALHQKLQHPQLLQTQSTHAFVPRPLDSRTPAGICSPRPHLWRRRRWYTLTTPLAPTAFKNPGQVRLGTRCRRAAAARPPGRCAGWTQLSSSAPAPLQLPLGGPAAATLCLPPAQLLAHCLRSSAPGEGAPQRQAAAAAAAIAGLRLRPCVALWRGPPLLAPLPAKLQLPQALSMPLTGFIGAPINRPSVPAQPSPSSGEKARPGHGLPAGRGAPLLPLLPSARRMDRPGCSGQAGAPASAGGRPSSPAWRSRCSEQL